MNNIKDKGKVYKGSGGNGLENGNSRSDDFKMENKGITERVYKSLGWVFSHGPNERGEYHNIIESFEDLNEVERKEILPILEYILKEKIENKNLMNDLIEESDTYEERKNLLNSMSGFEFHLIRDFIEDQGDNIYKMNVVNIVNVK